MSMGGFGFFRTIWLSIRATNYTTQAFKSAHKNLTDLQKAELQFAKNTMAVGTIYVAFGGIVLQTISRIISTSKSGEAFLERFGERISGSLAKIGDALVRILGPILDFVANALEVATAIPFFNEFVAIVMLGGTALLFAAGAAKILGGAMTLLAVMHGKSAASTAVHQQVLTAYIPTATAATGASLSLAAALKMVGVSAAVGLGVFIALKDVVGVLPAALFGLAAAFAALAVQMWLAAGAVSVLTLGAAAVAGGAALAGAIAMASNVGTGSEFQMGTRFAPRTMLALVHQGEAIINPSNQKPVGMFDSLMGKEARRVTHMTNTFDMRGAVIQTKADKEELRPFILRTIRDANRAKE